MTESNEKVAVRSCIAIALLMSGIAVFNTTLRPRNDDSRKARDRLFAPISAFADSAILVGEPKARRTVYFASDHVCPFCRAMRESLTVQMRADPMSMNVRILPFPLTAIHPTAAKSAAVLVCASQRGVQASADSLLFGLGSAIDSIPIDSLASKLGLSGSSEWLAKCVQSSAVSAYIARTSSLSAAAGATATPTMWINGRRFVGTTSVSALFAARP